ncbi:MAG: ABC transporter permease [Desulfovibrionaceae bacterium]|nr:ABC transporter permease [Desulfovibrionaceae bacterium]
MPPLTEVWEKRELFSMFVRRQFLVRYKQSILGVLWSVLTPLGTLFVFWLLFGLVLKVPSDGYPYVLFAFAGLTPWNIFNSSAMSTASSLQEQMGIVSKVYFPRIMLPFVTLTREFLDASIAMLLVIMFFALHGYLPTWRFLLLPVVLGAALFSGLAVGLAFAGPIVRFRDLRVPLNYVLQLAMYITPVIYPPTVIPEAYRWIIELNPMYWVIQVSRWCLLGQSFAVSGLLYGCLCFMVFMLLIGWLLFAYTERRIVDVQ